jgi:hypothetical protein
MEGVIVQVHHEQGRDVNSASMHQNTASDVFQSSACQDVIPVQSDD